MSWFSCFSVNDKIINMWSEDKQFLVWPFSASVLHGRVFLKDWSMFGIRFSHFVLFYLVVVAACRWQVISLWTLRGRHSSFHSAALCAGRGYNGLPVAVEPPSPLHQSELSTDQHSVQHNVGPLPWERRTSVNRRGNRECLDWFNWELMVCRDRNKQTFSLFGLRPVRTPPATRLFVVNMTNIYFSSHTLILYIFSFELWRNKRQHLVFHLAVTPSTSDLQTLSC